MAILAIDASTKSSGVCIFDEKELVYYDCITASSTDVIKRIYKMVDGIKAILQQYNIQELVIEEVRPDEGGSNPKTMKALLWLQAAIAFMLHDEFPKINITYVYPNEWRAACGIRTGRGITRVTLKQADMDFVKTNFNLDVNDDIADAICIGWGYLTKSDNELNWE